MPSTSDVLLFGHDRLLQQTRAWILERNGLRVDAASTLYEMKTCLAAKPYRLLLLCHSLTAGERATGISLAASFLPPVPSLALDKGTATVRHSFPAQVLHTKSGPEGLVSAVQFVLNKTEACSPLWKRKIIMAQFEGTVRWFNNAKGFGFLGRDGGGSDVFIHYTAIQSDGYKTLKEGDAVSFDVVQGDKGPQADQVRVLKR